MRRAQAPEGRGAGSARWRIRRLRRAVADRADRRLRPRTGNVERQAGGVLGFLAGRVRLDRIDLQSPALVDELDEPVEFSLHAVARHDSASDLSASLADRQGRVDLVERCGPQADVSLDVDRTAMTAAQGVL